MAMYLNGTSGEEITRLYTGEPPPPSGTWVGEAAAISGQQTGTDSWEVTVAVDSLEASDGGYSPAPLAFYVVPVSTAEGHATVLAAPARVPGPARRPAAPAPDAAVPTDLGEAAARFVELYLTGGDTALLMVERAERFRWFAPGVYGSATAEALGVDRLGRVTVAAQATTERGAVHRLEYLVTLTGSDRGWVVAEIGPAGK